MMKSIERIDSATRFLETGDILGVDGRKIHVDPAQARHVPRWLVEIVSGGACDCGIEGFLWEQYSKRFLKIVPMFNQVGQEEWLNLVQEQLLMVLELFRNHVPEWDTEFHTAIYWTSRWVGKGAPVEDTEHLLFVWKNVEETLETDPDDPKYDCCWEVLCIVLSFIRRRDFQEVMRLLFLMGSDYDSELAVLAFTDGIEAVEKVVGEHLKVN